MRKNVLSLSIAAMVGGLAAGAANAAVLNQNHATTSTTGYSVANATVLQPTTTGIGHVLVVPYFSTQGTNAHLLSITNTDTTNGKAVKLRFRGASNSDDIFDITLFLSPGDVWTAKVAADADGYSYLETSDSSCTLPAAAEIKAQNNGRFKTGRVLNGDKAQTREGYVEILNMADIPVNTASTSLYTAIKHPAGKPAPCTAAVMDAQYDDLVDTAGAANNALTRGYANPTGQLFANWIQLNVQDMSSHSGEAVAVRANVSATDATAAKGNIVFFPQNSEAPVYQAGVVGTGADKYTADPLLTNGLVTAANFDFPDLSTPYLLSAAAPASLVDGAGSNTADAQANALTQSLATTSIANEYQTGAGLTTDWVFSQPTRRYHVAVDYTATALTNRIVSRTSDYYGSNLSLDSTGYVICVAPGQMRGYDREENGKGSFVISPDTTMKLCGETSVLAFNAADGSASTFGSKLGRNNIAVGYAEGWMRIATPSASPVTGGVSGLPVIGYSALKANGINMGGTWAHRTAGR